MEPVVTGLMDRYGDKLEFIIVDITTGSGSQLAQEYNIRSVPTIIMLDEGGNTRYSRVGYALEAELAGAIRDLLGLETAVEP